MAKTDTYKEVRTFNYPGWTIRVHIPDLTPEERQRRMKAIERAAADVLRAAEKTEYSKRRKMK